MRYRGRLVRIDDAGTSGEGGPHDSEVLHSGVLSIEIVSCEPEPNENVNYDKGKL